jgi:hypothetical protein
MMKYSNFVSKVKKQYMEDQTTKDVRLGSKIRLMYSNLPATHLRMMYRTDVPTCHGVRR